MGKGGGGAGGASGQAMGEAAKLFLGSQGARLAIFRQLTSALRTGGRDMKSGLVSKAIADSTGASNAAVAHAGAGLSPTITGSIRGRILSRIAQAGASRTAAIGPRYAQGLINQAPQAIFGATGGANEALRVQAQGETSAMEAASTRAAGWSSAAQSIGAGLGTAAGGDWLKKYFSGGTPPPPAT